MTRAEEMQRLRDEERLTLKEIGERYGISKQRVAQLLGKQGRTVEEERLEAFRAERWAVIERVLAGEISVEEGAEIFGITQHTFRQYALDHFDVSFAKESPLHGTRYRYNRGCRCDECTEAMRASRRQLAEREPRKHGTQNAYTNYSCRCPKCKRWAKRRWAERRRDDNARVND